MQNKIIALAIEPEELGSIFYDEDSYAAYSLFLNNKACELKGLWNTKTKQLLLARANSMVSLAHETLAESKGLKINEKRLKEDWYGFDIEKYKDPEEIAISPNSGQYGGIPIEYHHDFEALMVRLFREHFPRILYYQYNYERHVPAEAFLGLRLEENLTEHPLDNNELFGPEIMEAIENYTAKKSSKIPLFIEKFISIFRKN